jgi:HPr kinase/phosphorylase
LAGLFQFEIPAVFVTKGQEVPAVFAELADAQGIPVLRSQLSTKEFYRRVKPYLEAVLAPATTLHGSLADVYGVGLLFVGKSGVGKSECVLDLVERGHRLVADDLVLVNRRGNDVLIGKGHPLQRHHMEIRGIGIIDIRAMFGIRAIRQQKRIEVVVQLEHWDEAGEYTRTGLDEDSADILGVEIPRVTVPLNPGKNITVISEVVAMNHLLRYSGVDAAGTFDRHLRDAMRPVEEYLEQDYE